MDIELNQTRVLIWKIILFLNILSLYIEALIPSFHKPLKASSIKFIGPLSEPGGDFPFHRYHDERHDMVYLYKTIVCMLYHKYRMQTKVREMCFSVLNILEGFKCL
jgi:hypothetical protein